MGDNSSLSILTELTFLEINLLGDFVEALFTAICTVNHRSGGVITRLLSLLDAVLASKISEVS